MTRNDRPYERVDRDSFDRIDAVAAGTDCVAVATGTDVRVLGDDSTTLELTDPVTDVVVGSTIGVLTESSLASYSRDGARRWEFDADGHAVASHPEKALWGLVGPDRFRIIDAESGAVVAATDRPRPGSAADDTLIGTSAGFALATWSFVTRFDDEGTVAFDRDLDSVVRELGWQSETLLAAVKRGNCLGLDLASGTDNWRLDGSISTFAVTGEAGIVARTPDGIVEITPDGDRTALPSLPPGDPYYLPEPASLALVEDRTITTYRPAPDRIDCAVPTESVAPGEAIAVEVSNPASDARRLSIEATLDHASLSITTVDVELGADATTEIEFPVADVTASSRAEFVVRVEGDICGRSSIELHPEADSSSLVDIDFTPRSIDHGTVELGLSVANASSTSIESVEILETGARSDVLQPGDVWQTKLTRQYEPNRRVSTGVEVVTVGKTREYAPTCTLPDPVSIDTEPVGDAIQATLSSPPDVTLSDTIVFDLPGVGRSRTQLSIDDGEQLLVIPQFETGVARISLEGTGVDERVRLSDPGLHSNTGSLTGTGSSGASATGSNPGTTATYREASTDRSRTDAGGSRTATDHLSIERRLDSKSVPTGAAVEETLVLTNDADTAVSVSVMGESEPAISDSIPSGDVVSVTRLIAPLGAPGEEAVPIPDPPISADGRSIETDGIAPRHVELAPRGIETRAVLDPAAATLSLELTNGTDDPVRVTEIAIDETQCDGLATVEPGDTESASWNLENWGPQSIDATRAGYPIVLDLASGDRRRVLARVAQTRTGDANESSAADPPLHPTIGTDTQVAGSAGTVILVLENDLGNPVSDVRISAHGDVVNEKFYAEAHRETLKPGDRIEHFVDLTYESTDPAFEADVSYVVNGNRTERRVLVAGTAASDRSEWTADHLDSWSVEPVSTTSLSSLDVDGATLLTTPFSLTSVDRL